MMIMDLFVLHVWKGRMTTHVAGIVGSFRAACDQDLGVVIHQE